MNRMYSGMHNDSGMYLTMLNYHMEKAFMAWRKVASIGSRNLVDDTGFGKPFGLLTLLSIYLFIYNTPNHPLTLTLPSLSQPANRPKHSLALISLVSNNVCSLAPIALYLSHLPNLPGFISSNQKIKGCEDEIKAG